MIGEKVVAIYFFGVTVVAWLVETDRGFPDLVGVAKVLLLLGIPT